MLDWIEYNLYFTVMRSQINQIVIKFLIEIIELWLSGLINYFISD